MITNATVKIIGDRMMRPIITMMIAANWIMVTLYSLFDVVTLSLKPDCENVINTIDENNWAMISYLPSNSYLPWLESISHEIDGSLSENRNVCG